ncbi:MAG: chaperone NapD [bacterium]
MNVYNVCGVVVMTRPENAARVEAELNELEGVEVHARDDRGKLVVTVEGLHSRECANVISDFSNIKGVVSTSLVYHEIEVDKPVGNSSESSYREDRV